MKLLVIDDDPAVAEGLREAYAGRALAPEISVSPNAPDAHRRLRQAPGAFAVVLANPSGWAGRPAAGRFRVRPANPGRRAGRPVAGGGGTEVRPPRGGLPRPARAARAARARRR